MTRLFDFEMALARSLSEQKAAISAKARAAVDRLYWMHAVGSGICGCGTDLADHPAWDNHGPIEIPIDKSAECPHHDFSSRPLGNGVSRHTCIDCGETHDVSLDVWWRP